METFPPLNWNTFLTNLDEPLTQAEVQWIVGEADIDGDGTISFDEFKKMMMSCGAVR